VSSESIGKQIPQIFLVIRNLVEPGRSTDVIHIVWFLLPKCQQTSSDC